MIEQLGLRIAGMSRDTSSLQPENSVIRQIPAAGQTISAGGPVSLTVSHFPPPPSIKIDTGISAPPPSSPPLPPSRFPLPASR